MDEPEDAPLIKDFGPPTSLRKKRLWGTVCLVLAIGFLVVSTAMSDGSSIQDGSMTFGRDTAKTPPIWAIALGICTVLAISIGAPVLANKLPKIDENSDDQVFFTGLFQLNSFVQR